MRTIIFLVTMASSVLHTTNATAACPAVDYKTPSPTSGRIRLSMSGFVFGHEMGSVPKCFTGHDDVLQAFQYGLALQRATSGTVVAWIQVSGEGDYDIFYRGMNRGHFEFQAHWPIVMTAARRLEVQPEHPAAQMRSNVREDLGNYFAPLGTNKLAFNFRFPVFKDEARLLPTVEVTVTDRTTSPPGLSVGPLSVPIEGPHSSFAFQVKPWFIVQLPPNLRS